MEDSSNEPPRIHCTVFDGVRLLTSGTLPDVALAAKVVMLANRGEPLIFDDATGRRLELDLYPSAAQVLKDYAMKLATT